MNKLTNFEWYNEKGRVIRFDDNFGENFFSRFQNNPLLYHDFVYDKVEERNLQTGVRWSYNKSIIDIKNATICSLPTPNMDKVIVDISELFGEYQQIRYTTTIYNADGSVHKVVEMPRPIMPNLGRGPTRDEKPHTSEVYWCRKKVDGYSMLIQLGYYAAWEERYFNPETGEIGGLFSNKSYGYY